VTKLQGLRELIAGKLTSGAARSLVLSMGAAVATRLGMLLLAILIGRRFGPDDYGAFTFATGLALLVAQGVTLGWPILMNRLIPEMLRDRQWSALRGLRDAGDWIATSGSLIAAAILFALSAMKGELGIGFLLGALLVFPQAIAILRRQQLAALRRPAVGLLFDQGFGAVIAVILVFVIPVPSIVEVVAIFAAAMLFGNLFTTVLLRRMLPPEVSAARRSFSMGPWMAMALPMLIGISSRLLMNRLDVVMLAPLGGLYESGLYGAAFRITMLLTFPQIVLMTVITPLISDAFAHNQPQRIRSLQKNALIFAAITAVPVSLILMLFPGPILVFLFGEEFRPAASVLVLLAAGQLATGLSIPLQAVLTMGGRERSFGALNLAALAMHVLLNFALITPYGALGAAISTAIVSIFLALSLVWANKAGAPPGASTPC